MLDRTYYSLIFTFLLCLLLTSNQTKAQCNNVVDLSTDCDFLFLLDGTLVADGFCSRLPEDNPIEELTPFCLNLSSSENSGFFLIEPTTTTLKLKIKPLVCTTVEVPGQGFSTGMQAAIFTDCNFDNAVACSPLCSDGEFTVGGDDFVPFQTYLLVFDGCNGSICDFEIEVQSGALSNIIPLVEPILNSPEEVCTNESNRIEVQGLPALTSGVWTMDGIDVFTTLFNGKAIAIDNWGAPGLREICAEIKDPQSGEMYFDSCWNVNVLPAPIINNFPQDSLLCFDDKLNLFIEGFNYSSILWSGPGLSCNSCPTPTLTMPDSSIVITATASNGFDCESSIELFIDLLDDPSCFVSTNENAQYLPIDIAPNPFQNYFQIELIAPSIVHIYSASGQLVFEGENIEGDLRLETSSWSNGIYLIQVQSEIGVGSQRLLKL